MHMRVCVHACTHTLSSDIFSLFFLSFFSKHCPLLQIPCTLQHYITTPHHSTDLKPFACSLCEKAFKQKQHLDRHLQCHSGELHMLHTVKPVYGGHPKSTGPFPCGKRPPLLVRPTPCVKRERERPPCLVFVQGWT